MICASCSGIIPFAPFDETIVGKARRIRDGNAAAVAVELDLRVGIAKNRRAQLKKVR